MPVLLVGALLAMPARSFASPGTVAAIPSAPPPAPLETAQPGRWYGWELMLSDTFFLLVANDGRIDKPELGLGSHQFALGLSGLVLGAPTLHFIHGNRRRAAVGLAVRAAIVGLYAIANDAVGGSDNSSNSGVGDGDIAMAFIYTGAILGGLVFAAIDDVWYARVPPPEPVRPQTALAPTFFFGPRGGGLGLAARF